jgi:signal transduction histidine kinase/CheY-like chemotaxis protein
MNIVVPAIFLILMYFLEQETVNIQSHEQQDGTYPFLIINDLEREDRFGELPFVQGEPRSRFYAGTPLTSESNINLGCLFILDPEPREGLSDVEKDILGTVAAMVMDFLQVSRQAVEGRRASRLSQGLRLFVDGNSSFTDNAPLARSHISNCSPPSHTSPYRRASRSTNSQNSRSNIRTAQSENDGVPFQDCDARSSSPFSTEELETGMSNSPAPSSHSSRQGDGGSMVSSNTDWLFQRAANLLRQSLDLDGTGGVMLLETNDDLSDSPARSQSDPADTETPGPVLALSTREDPFSYQTGSEVSYPAVKLENTFLNQLSRRYPKGRLWSFHRDGSLSTSDEEQSVGARRKYNQTSRALEASKLKAYFPDASQVMFVPLWNANSLQWFAGCFSWTPQSTRVFSRAVDLSSMFGFASSIMTEYSRIESVVADRQKGDFISSISHELRSPLHGVLAAAEFLGGTHLDEFQESLLETVNACGRTLLDTMNQVLDFSKILSLDRQKKRYKRKKDPWRPKAPDEVPTRLDPLVSTNVAILTEDVVDSVCLGHSHIQRSTLPIDHRIGESPTPSSTPSEEVNKVAFNPAVEVIVDISDNDWFYNVQPGSLRRIIMNLLGNSLKYTGSGLVSVSIQATENSEGRSRRQGLEDMVTLTVSDTGKGISDEYLRTRLYTPFAQEDTLSVGTGLGLSIVRGIVRTLHGNIRIKSRVGEGTTVKVTIPLERPVGEKSLSSTPHVKNSEQKTLTAVSQLCQLDLTGKRAAIWGVDPSCLGEYQFWSSIAQYITDWYGLKLVPWSTNEHIDVLLANESDLSADELQSLNTALPSMLIFRDNTGSSSDTRAQWSHLAHSLVILRLPCGPQKLARGILNCLDPKPASPAPRSQPSEQEFVIPERPRPSGPTPSTGSSKSQSSENLEPPAAGSSNFMTASCSCVMDTAERNVSGESPDIDSSSRLSPGSGASSSHTHSSSSSYSSPSGSTPIDSSSGAKSKPRVLLVDDNDINLRLIRTFMRKWNITAVDTAQNGKEAVDLVEKMPPGYDLIFMDMSMPVMNGFEATRTIRAIERDRGGSVRAKIIAFTGLSSLRDESQALESGVDVFLTKPVSFKAVSRLIEDWEIGLSK